MLPQTPNERMLPRKIISNIFYTEWKWTSSFEQSPLDSNTHTYREDGEGESHRQHFHFYFLFHSKHRPHYLPNMSCKPVKLEDILSTSIWVFPYKNVDVNSLESNKLTNRKLRIATGWVSGWKQFRESRVLSPVYNNSFYEPVPLAFRSNQAASSTLRVHTDGWANRP